MKFSKVLCLNSCMKENYFPCKCKHSSIFKFPPHILRSDAVLVDRQILALLWQQNVSVNRYLVQHDPLLKYCFAF